MANILLAEDDYSMREFLTLALTKAGHTITACEHGLAAMKALNEHNGKFDLLLADIVMPGMDGVELSQKATHLYPDLKVMFITGFAAVAMERESEMSADAKVMSKPFHLKDLVQQGETLLAA